MVVYSYIHLAVQCRVINIGLTIRNYGSIKKRKKRKHQIGSGILKIYLKWVNLNELFIYFCEQNGAIEFQNGLDLKGF